MNSTRIHLLCIFRTWSCVLISGNKNKAMEQEKYRITHTN
jgi:hypothetical protein